MPDRKITGERFIFVLQLLNSMLPDKELKAHYRPIFWKTPEKYYAVQILKEDGFTRHICKKCGKPFWSIDSAREACGDPSCAEDESFAFIGKSPAKHSLEYVEVWKKFSRMFSEFGYKPIKRYPVVARWNPTMDYTNASIAAFQPYVISGEVEPPANPLIIPQFCLRFGDIDNVGITESHNTGFVMIGQHSFQEPKNWNQNMAFWHIKQWLNHGLGLEDKELIFHEDAWAGGGNLGCCMEFYSRGCELGNQVYMLYEQTPSGVKDLKIKVLDMGMGMERNAWFSQGKNTIYNATFPKVIKKLLAATGVKQDSKLLERYIPYAGLLNLDEVEDINKAWQIVAEKVGISAEELKQKILPLRSVYAIAEHARSLLVVLNDGALPSNIGGGYNLRVLARRAMSFIEDNHWNIYLPDVCKWHAEELKGLFPELSENLENIQKIIEVEKEKFESTKQKTRYIITKVAKEKLTEEKLLQYYDSYGITPEMVQEEALKHSLQVKVPEDFYNKVAARHLDTKPKEIVPGIKELKIDTSGIQPTETSYYEDWKKREFKAKITKVEGNLVVLDETYFYPTSGGQDHDTGEVSLNSETAKVINIFKYGPHIVHVLDRTLKLKAGDSIQCRIDFRRRMQLTQHHTAAHIINAAARRVLGHHINQAGAKKSVERGHLDVTHYKSISEDELAQIEKEANKIIQDAIEVRKMSLPRSEAEKRYGLAIYQGGAVPGKIIRIVEIPEVDVEACGGTHVDNTKEVEVINIFKSIKIADGVVRLLYVAGEAAKQTAKHDQDLLKQAAEILNVSQSEVPGRAEELFEAWKKLRKDAKRKKILDKTVYKLSKKEEYFGDSLAKTAEILNTQPEHIPQTIKRFLADIEAWLR